MLLTPSDLSATDVLIRNLDEAESSSNRDRQSRLNDHFDRESWEIYRCWIDQPRNRFGAGTPAPSIPRSQRQFDGDNWFDNCEPWID